jgi:hypothetical protein
VSLQDWLKSRWLVEHKTSHQEIVDLLGMADRDLAQCQTPNLSSDWELSIAYNAALQAATAALAAAGYRAAREAHHYRVIQSLAYTIKADPILIAQLDKFRKKRNISEYERAGVASEQEAKEMFVLAKNLRDKVEKWLHSNHPELL